MDREEQNKDAAAEEAERLEREALERESGPAAEITAAGQQEAAEDSFRAETSEISEASGSFGESVLEAAPTLADEMELEAAEAPEESEAEVETLSELELNEVIESICNSKADEFRMLGYEHVTGKDIWDCVIDKYKKTGTPALHKIVNDILSLKVTSFMNWMTMSIYKSNPFQ